MEDNTLVTVSKFTHNPKKLSRAPLALQSVAIVLIVDLWSSAAAHAFCHTTAAQPEPGYSNARWSTTDVQRTTSIYDSAGWSALPSGTAATKKRYSVTWFM